MKQVIILILVLMPDLIYAQDLAVFSVQPVKGAGIAPVAVSLDGVNYNTDNYRIALYESGSAGLKEVPCQLETGTSARLWFLFDNREGVKEYVIRRIADDQEYSLPFLLIQTEQATTIKKGGVPVLSYNHAEVFPPGDVDIKYRRAAFIHPLWSPKGEVLTRIQPPDHYHHYGIWNPWTKTTIEGREVDFWNLLKGEGTVKFAGYLDAVKGQVYAGLKVLHEHVSFIFGDHEKLALNEVWDVRVWETGKRGTTMVDFTATLNTPVKEGIILDSYRYGGGIGYRATEKWHRDNCTVLTSEGKTRSEADGTNARWSIVEGESSLDQGRSGILFLSHPSNRMHPEPMRVWPLDANSGRGDMFFQFCPIRHKDWKLDHGRNYTLKYRMILFDGNITAEEAETEWKSFALSPSISFNE